MYTKYIVNQITIIKFNSDVLTDQIKQKIDELIIQICEGSKSFRLGWFAEPRDVSIAKVKKELYTRIQSKSLDTQKGMISEFFIHLILNQEQFKQECLFFNMAERSIKKGFDGMYSFKNEFWIVDSKSGDCKTKNISHSSTINNAYNNCKRLLDGTGTTNDVWAEAWHNVDVKSVKASWTVRKTVKRYRLAAENNSPMLIENSNIIPCGTIFARKTSSYKTHCSYKFNGKEHIFKQPNAKIILFHSTNNFFIDFLRYLKKDY